MVAALVVLVWLMLPVVRGAVALSFHEKCEEGMLCNARVGDGSGYRH